MIYRRSILQRNTNLVAPANSPIRSKVDEHRHIQAPKATGERLQETYMVAAVAGEGEEVDLVAVADAAVLPQVGELRRAHPAEPRRAPRPAPGEPRR